MIESLPSRVLVRRFQCFDSNGVRLMKCVHFSLGMALAFMGVATPGMAPPHQNQEKTILQATPERFRFMPGAVLNVDGKNHLITVVAEFGKLVGDNSPNK